MKFTTAFFGGLIASFVIGAVALAYGWTPDTRLTSAPKVSTHPAIAVDPDGNVHTVWSDNRDGNPEIYYKQVAPNGETVVPDTRITYDGASSEFPAVAADAEGVYIVWHDDRDRGADIYYAALSREGRKLTDDIQLTSGRQPAFVPVIARDPWGNLDVTWYDYRTWDWEIYGMQITPRGTVTVPRKRLTDASGTSALPAIATDAAGNIHILWQDIRDGIQRLRYLKLDPRWEILVTDTAVVFGGNPRAPRIAVDGEGNIHGVFDAEASGGREIYYVKLSWSDGRVLVQPSRVTTAPRPSYFPDIAYNSSHDRLFVVWEDFRDSNFEVYGADIDSAGRKIGNDARLTNEAHASKYPRVAFSPDGQIYIVWRDSRDMVGRDGNFEIYAKQSLE